MSELDYIGVDELIFNNDKELGIHSGGFSVKSIMMKAGMSPIMTLNHGQVGGTDKVSDIFNNLVVPNWILSYNDRIYGGNNKDIIKNKANDEDTDDDVIDDDLHDKLLDLVREHDITNKSKIQRKKKITRKYKNNQNKKNNTKKRLK